MAGIFQNGVFSMGFDMDPTAAQILTLNANGNSSTTTPFAYGYSWTINNAYAGIQFGTNLTTVICGIRVYGASLPGGGAGLFEWYDVTGAAVQLQLIVSGTGALQFYRGSGTSNPIGSASSAGIIAGAQWTYIETKVTISPTAGLVECRINGNATPVISSSGLNTQATANTWVSGFNFGWPVVGYFDDWYMLDTTGASPLNSYLGNVQVKGDKPNNNSAVGGRNAWSPTNPTNVNYTNVGNIPANTSEYDFDSNVGDYDMFRFPPLTAATVFFLNEWAMLSLDSAGTRTVELDCYSNGTDAVSAAVTPPGAGSPGYFNYPFVVDPHTGSAWTVSNAEVAELGVKVAS